jgi:hypothetical protein
MSTNCNRLDPLCEEERNLFGRCLAATLLWPNVVRTSGSVTSTLICSRGTTSQIGTDSHLLAAVLSTPSDSKLFSLHGPVQQSHLADFEFL